MEVFLLNDVANLGKTGDLLKVKPGYARNFLFPRKLAVLASVNSRRQLEHQKRLANDLLAKVKADAEGMAKRLQQVVVVVARKVGDQDKLFGSVTVRDVQEALKEQHQIEIDRHDLQLEDAVKALGTFPVGVRLQGGVQAAFQLQVTPESN